MAKFPDEVVFFQPTLHLGVLFVFHLENAEGFVWLDFCGCCCFNQLLRERVKGGIFGIMESFINNIDTLICMEAHILLKYVHTLLQVTAMRSIRAAFYTISPVPRNVFLIVKIHGEDRVGRLPSFEHLKNAFFPHKE